MALHKRPQCRSTELALINQAKEALGLLPENLNILTTKNTDNGLIKLDQQFSKNNRLSPRYNIFDGRETNLLVGDTLDGGGMERPAAVTMHSFGIRPS